jgi:hypothetical protein
MTKFTKIGNPGTALSCATPMGTTAGQGTGMGWHAEYVVSASARAAAVTRVLGIDVVRTDVDLPTRKQPKIHLPQPPLERSP